MLGIKLVDVDTSNAREEQTGTCELCFGSMWCDNPIFIFENPKGDRVEIDGYFWSWGDYLELEIDNHLRFSEYREIKKVIRTYNEFHFELYVYDEVIMASEWVNKKLVELLEKRLEILESELNLLGYTFEDKSKEWQCHVNILKGEDDE